jgi:hypothetical protein
MSACSFRRSFLREHVSPSTLFLFLLPLLPVFPTELPSFEHKIILFSCSYKFFHDMTFGGNFENRVEEGMVCEEGGKCGVGGL